MSDLHNVITWISLLRINYACTYSWRQPLLPYPFPGQHLSKYCLFLTLPLCIVTHTTLSSSMWLIFFQRNEYALRSTHSLQIMNSWVVLQRDLVLSFQSELHISFSCSYTYRMRNTFVWVGTYLRARTASFIVANIVLFEFKIQKSDWKNQCLEYIENERKTCVFWF